MFYAWVDGVKRKPLKKGERAICKDCDGVLLSVMPKDGTPHWRHKAGDCDSWSEGEGEWHLYWKDLFDVSCQEVSLKSSENKVVHRADVLVGQGTQDATVLELQHSSILDEDIAAREVFYGQNNRMFWLVHVHGEKSFLDYSFASSLDFSSRPIKYQHHDFAVMTWMGRSKIFIERWKRAKAHVFFNFSRSIYYLVGEATIKRMGIVLAPGEFVLGHVSFERFINAVCSNNLAGKVSMKTLDLLKKLEESKLHQA